MNETLAVAPCTISDKLTSMKEWAATVQVLWILCVSFDLHIQRDIRKKNNVAYLLIDQAVKSAVNYEWQKDWKWARKKKKKTQWPQYKCQNGFAMTNRKHKIILTIWPHRHNVQDLIWFVRSRVFPPAMTMALLYRISCVIFYIVFDRIVCKPVDCLFFFCRFFLFFFTACQWNCQRPKGVGWFDWNWIWSYFDSPVTDTISYFAC